MPSDERRYRNLETRERNDENWKRRSRETDKEKIDNLTVSVHDMNEISGTEKGSRKTVKEREKLGM